MINKLGLGKLETRVEGQRPGFGTAVSLFTFSFVSVLDRQKKIRKRVTFHHGPKSPNKILCSEKLQKPTLEESPKY